jgi:excinuclease ABC subunit C
MQPGSPNKVHPAGKNLVVNADENVQFEVEPGKPPRSVPVDPGVYLFKDAAGHVIYVGKAKNLRKRVQSYFRKPPDKSRKAALMISKARGLDCMLTASENEAFILESTLIRKFVPRYNIILRDDKRYPSLRMDLKEPYPRLRIVRKIRKDGALYFGPFSSAQSVRRTLKMIDRVFRLRKCKDRRMPKRSRPCLNYQMDRCLGPCTREVSMVLYQGMVHQVRLFLEGRNQELIDQLKEEMDTAADHLEFERAAEIRDQIRAIERTVEKQDVVSPRLEDRDVIGVAKTEGLVQVAVLHIRGGYLAGSRNFLFRDQDPGDPAEVVEAFLKQYYAVETFIPKEILTSTACEDLPAIGAWLSSLSGGKVSLHRPLRGEKLRLVRMADANAGSVLAGQEEASGRKLMENLQMALKLEKPPETVEGLDISNFYGDQAVGTVVRFEDGQPRRSGYRNFRIKGVDGIDDYAMMAEVVRRRVAAGRPPDLFVVDGGRGHLNVVKKVLAEFECPGLPEAVAIAKPDQDRGETRDKIFIHGRKNPVRLEERDPILLFLMRVRDEAHRRAVSYHRRMREKALTVSDLEHIPGVGKKTKNKLLTHFKSMNGLARAGLKEVADVPGINRALAKRIVQFFDQDAEEKV